jgi:AraC-like DNA-binding protein
LTVPVGASSWQPNPAASRTLRALHAAAIKLFESRPAEVLAASAVRGLEQQMIHALVECLSNGVAGVHDTSAAKRHRRIVTCFEDACVTYADRMPALVEICTMLGVPERTLRTSCEQYLGMGPMIYLRLRRMNLVRRALRAARPPETNVQELARHHGFSDLGRFAATYRRLFGELPSATLQRNAVGI